jgi:uncharacterized membrane protein YozB (DUF420 family)
VDRGRVTGLFDSNDSTAIDTLMARARRSAAPGWVRSLPAVDASLNGLCACLLVLGWSLIRRSSNAEKGPLMDRRLVRGHRLCMLLAVLASAVFLACYLTYHYYSGSVSFRGSGSIRLIYFTILISHTVLATFGVVPLVVLTLLRALRGDFAHHRSIAATTFPIWLYVSITGVVIYLMLYHLPVSATNLVQSV